MNREEEAISGYYRFPTVYRERVVFVAEDDLWEVPLAGGVARRLTSHLGTVSQPRFSGDGNWLAFTACEEGPDEVYLMPSQGGKIERLTFLGAMTRVVGWRGDQIIFASTFQQPERHPPWLFSVCPRSGRLQLLPLGPASRLDEQQGRILLGRNSGDPARWKRYRGGTAGEILIDREGSGEFSRLLHLKGNLTDPMWVGDRVYFISDHDEIGNLYSCSPEGSDLRRHTDQAEFYVRNASCDGCKVVFHAGADVFVFDPVEDRADQLAIRFYSQRTQTNRKYVKASDYLDSYALSQDGAMLTVTCRGKAFAMPCWEGAVVQWGLRHEARYRLTALLNDGQRLVACSDEGGEDHIEVFGRAGAPADIEIRHPQLGRPMALDVSPVADALLVVNHRNELLHIDLQEKAVTLLDRDACSPIRGFCWAPDGRWAAYAISLNHRQSIIKIVNLESGERFPITRPVLIDSGPVFDPDGRYLYFLSRRVLNPVYDNLHFDLGFPGGMRPYLVTLRADGESPFVPKPEGFGTENRKNDKDPAKGDASSASEGEKNTAERKPLIIDLDGIENRVIAFPVSEGNYLQLAANKDRVFYTTKAAEGALGSNWRDRVPPAKATLKVYDLKKREEKHLSDRISGFQLSRNGEALAIRSGQRLRVVAASSDKLKQDDDKSSRKSGWIDLSRPRIEIDPRSEWLQMLHEAWRLQRYYFWNEGMGGTDWNHVLERYLPLVRRVASRHEFADLIWEMQGELGTSHAYELGGDYRESPRYSQGFLGVDLTWDEESEAWRLTHLVEGDGWDSSGPPPFSRPGVNASPGMRLLEVAGRPVDAACSPSELLVNQADQEIAVRVAEADGSSPRTVMVRCLHGEGAIRYREWAEENRRRVHALSAERVGYIHIPDMGPRGFAEFHRYFLVELEYPGLVVDVRYNGGGHVSQLLLEKLARRRIGYDQTRWMGLFPYPDESPRGPMVCLTNELAGSDGDIVSHGFKLMGLGKLIGRRTWGGVIGIWPRNTLVDGTLTTQPEFSFWFKDVGWGVENYGVDPDIEVDMLPQDWASGRDPQLQRAVEEVLGEIDSFEEEKPD